MNVEVMEERAEVDRAREEARLEEYRKRVLETRVMSGAADVPSQ